MPTLWPQDAPAPSPHIAAMTAYSAKKHGAPMDLWLDGIGGLAPRDDFVAGLAGADLQAMVRGYPSSAELEALLAEELGTAPANVVVTAGADDGLDRACRAFLAPGRSLVLPVPTFEMIERYAAWAGATVRPVAWAAGPYPLAEVVAAADGSTGAVAVVSPNNPTGLTVDIQGLCALSAALPHAVLLVDLAYVEFADDDLTATVLALPNAIGFRTFSKAWGLAGLRVGYAFGAANLMQWLRISGHPYAVSGPSLHWAKTHLQLFSHRVTAYVQQVRANRQKLFGQLVDLDLRPLPSQANFVLARTTKAVWIRDALAGMGIAVRAWPGHPLLAEAVRISVPGPSEEADRLASALEIALKPQAILLDMDGVIVDTSGSFRQAIVQTCARFGLQATLDDIAEIKAKGNANNDWVVTRRMLAAAGIDVPQDEVTAYFESLYQGTATCPGLKLGERLLLEPADWARIAAKLPIAIVTGRPRKDAEFFLNSHGITSFVQTVVCMEDGPAKPDPFPVQLALQRLGLTRAWMVGDTPDDIRACRAANVLPIGVPAPGDNADSAAQTLIAAGAARVLPSIRHLLEILP